MQSKKQSLIESVTNTIVGLITSFFIQIIIYLVMNIPVSTKQNIVITLVFFIASIGRSYIIRRIFNRKKELEQ